MLIRFGALRKLPVLATLTVAVVLASGLADVPATSARAPMCDSTTSGRVDDISQAGPDASGLPEMTPSPADQDSPDASNRVQVPAKRVVSVGNLPPAATPATPQEAPYPNAPRPETGGLPRQEGTVPLAPREPTVGAADTARPAESADAITPTCDTTTSGTAGSTGAP